jgi:hypothetical protein
MIQLQPRLVAVAALSLTLLAACGNIQERSLCRQYGDLQESVAAAANLDPATTTAEDVVSVVDDVLADLGQLQATSEGLYDTSISTLRTSLTELRQAAFDLGEESFEVARPLLEGSLADSLTAYEALRARLDVVCAAQID